MKKQKRKLMPRHHIAGWYGSIAIVSGYFLSSFGVLDSGSIIYQIINLSGAAGLFYLGFHKHIKESMFLNGFWIVIATISLLRLLV
jgi:hypothetical protein